VYPRAPNLVRQHTSAGSPGLLQGVVGSMREILTPVAAVDTTPAAVFCEIEPPPMHAASTMNRFATWHTWSDEFRIFLRDASAELNRLSEPRLCRVDGLTVYNQTFSWSPNHLKDRGIQQRLACFARSLYAAQPGRRILLLHNLLGPDLDSGGLHALFAMIRGALVELAGDPRAAMYTPLGEVGRDARGFALHADLYIPPMLLNVFDHVAADDTGASTFLSVSELRRLISSVGSLPAQEGRKIMALFDRPVRSDRFEDLYDLLHGDHPWARDLEEAMEQRQLSIKMESGQGYLLHDRTWLHGREAPTGGVPADRVRRLVFGLGPARSRKCMM
jgi:hypothetical protein